MSSSPSPPLIPPVTPATLDTLPLDVVLSYAKRLLTRRDTYAVQQPDGRYQRVASTVDREALVAHLTGTPTMALYVLDGRRRARWLCFDSDDTDGLAHLFAVQQALDALGLTTLREASRRGGHLWLLCGQPVLAATLRGLALGVLALLAARGDLSDVIAQRIEVYPSVDALGGWRLLAASARTVRHPSPYRLGVLVCGDRRTSSTWLDGGRGFALVPGSAHCFACHGPQGRAAIGG